METTELKLKLQNFWYYYKWYVIGGVIGVIVLLVGIRSCNLKPKSDFDLLYARDTSHNPLQVQALEDWLSPQVPDRDENGEPTARILTSANNDQFNGYDPSTMLVQVNSGQAILYLVSEEIYGILHENEVLQPLDFLGDHPKVEGDRFNATDLLKTVEGWNEDTTFYFCLRKVAGTTLQNKEHCIEQEKIAKELLTKWAKAE